MEAVVVVVDDTGTRQRNTMGVLPPFLPREPLVEERQYLRHVKLDVLEVQVVLVVLLHFKEVIQLQVELQ